jgi:diadenylate cyclase
MSLETLLEPLTQIRVADVVDIALVSALVYATIALLRRTQAAFVAIGVLLMAVLYIVANLLDLRLTVWIFQGFFAVFLVILVVIFQQELRQLFERVAVWSLRRRGSRTLPDSSTLDVVA